MSGLAGAHAVFDPAWAALGVLLDVTLRGSLLLVAASLVTLSLRRASAALRHLVWTIAVSGVLALPLLLLALPSWRIELLPATATALPWTATVASERDARTRPQPIGESAASRAAADRAANTDGAADRPSAGAVSGLVAPGVGGTAPAGPTPAASSLRSPAATSRSPVRGVSWTWVMLGVWLVGAGATIAWLAIGRLAVRAVGRRARPVRAPAWREAAASLARALDIRRRIVLRESDRVTVPMTWGIRRPVVLLPAAAHEWPCERVRLALLHELAHVRRLDAFTQLLAQVCLVVCWFNPLVWLAARQMRRERELACDDRVLAHGAPASGYARDLLEIARSGMSPRHTVAAALAMTRRSELEGRLLAILDGRRRRAGVGPYAGAAMTSMAVGLILPLATVRIVPRPRDLPAARATGRAGHLHGGGRSGFGVDSRASETAASGATAIRARIAVADTRSAARRTPGHHPDSARVDTATLIAVAQSAERMTSDFDKAELLVEVTAHAGTDASVLSAIVHAAGTVRGEFDHARVLEAVVRARALPAPVALSVIRSAGAMSSDYFKANVLTALAAAGGVRGEGARQAYIAAARSISADAEYRRAMAAVVDDR